MKPQPLTDKIARMIAPETRRAMRIELPEDRSARVEAGEEREFQADVVAYLRSAKGIQQIDVVPLSRGNPEGVPDIVFAFHGRPVFLELKTSAGKTTPAQDQDHERRLLDGWQGGVFRSLPQIKAFLDRIEHEANAAAVASPGSLARQNTGADTGEASNASYAKPEGMP
jgi:hypothetical protein